MTEEMQVMPRVPTKNSRRGPELIRGGSVQCWGVLPGSAQTDCQDRSDPERDLGERLRPNSKGPETRFGRGSSNQACQSAYAASR
jgi:hypothetical protein